MRIIGCDLHARRKKAAKMPTLTTLLFQVGDRPLRDCAQKTRSIMFLYLGVDGVRLTRVDASTNIGLQPDIIFYL
jgi:hypothetical protein